MDRKLTRSFQTSLQNHERNAGWKQFAALRWMNRHVLQYHRLRRELLLRRLPKYSFGIWSDVMTENRKQWLTRFLKENPQIQKITYKHLIFRVPIVV